MAGGGSETQTTAIEIPQWLQEAAQSGLARGQQAAGIGYVPYRGPDVAALTPLQEAAMFNTSQASSAFGLGASPLPGAGMPTVQTFADGTRGYSAFPLYEQAVNELKMRDPAQYAKLMTPFTQAAPFSITSMPMAAAPVADPVEYYSSEPPQGSASSRNTSFDTYSTPASQKDRAMSYGPQPKQQGFTSVRDMFDGGGPGASKPSASKPSGSSSKGKK